MINIYIFYRQGSGVRGQGSVVRGQGSGVRGQWSVVSGQWSVVSRQPSAYFIQKLFGVACPQTFG
ncbi:MAG: hypothetical protein F6K56_23465 [Moorea sp. SIO3G5]|nr:hypothetical protein [Moorena sp. SIO3G5]